MPIPAPSKEDVWRAHMTGYEQSGRSQRKYCAEHNLSLATFTVWRRRLVLQKQDVEMVPVPKKIRGTRPPVVVILEGGRYRVEVAEGFQHDTLEEVLNLLEAR